MKALFSLAMFFLFLLGFGQGKKSNYQKRQEIYQETFELLMNESKTVNLRKLEKIVLNNIDEKKLIKNNLVFIIKDLDEKIFAFEIDAYQYAPSTALHPYFNQATFWTKKNINYLVNKFKKNLIPSKSIYQYSFINDSIQLKNLDNKIFAKELSKQKKGKYIQEETRKISEKEFLYFPYRNENLELKRIENENINFDVIDLQFRNFQSKVVSFKIIYNNDLDKVVVKTYQYQNKSWVEIPTKKEYEF